MYTGLVIPRLPNSWLMAYTLGENTPIEPPHAKLAVHNTDWLLTAPEACFPPSTRECLMFVVYVVSIAMVSDRAPI